MIIAISTICQSSQREYSISIGRQKPKAIAKNSPGEQHLLWKVQVELLCDGFEPSVSSKVLHPRGKSCKMNQIELRQKQKEKIPSAAQSSIKPEMQI